MKQHSIKKHLNQRLEKVFPNLLMVKKTESIPLKIKWRRIYILPTKPGLFFGVVCVLMLVASLNFNNNLGLILTFLLVGMAQVAMHRVFFNLKDLKIHSVKSSPVFAGGTAKFDIHLESEQEKYDLELTQGKEADSILVLSAEKKKSFILNKPANQRGWLSMDRIKISTSYPFGLFRAWVWTHFEKKCLVYPKPEVKPPAFPQQINYGEKSSHRLQGEDFHGLKPYHPGDSKRLIAWKRTAQTGELVSREFETLSGDQLIFDYSHIQGLDKESRVSRLTAWVMDAHKKNAQFKLVLPTLETGFDSSKDHYYMCLKALALF